MIPRPKTCLTLALSLLGSLASVQAQTNAGSATFNLPNGGQIQIPPSMIGPPSMPTDRIPKATIYRTPSSEKRYRLQKQREERALAREKRIQGLFTRARPQSTTSRLVERQQKLSSRNQGRVRTPQGMVSVQDLTPRQEVRTSSLQSPQEISARSERERYGFQAASALAAKEAKREELRQLLRSRTPLAARTDLSEDQKTELRKQREVQRERAFQAASQGPRSKVSPLSNPAMVLDHDLEALHVEPIALDILRSIRDTEKSR